MIALRQGDLLQFPQPMASDTADGRLWIHCNKLLQAHYTCEQDSRPAKQSWHCELQLQGTLCYVSEAESPKASHYRVYIARL